MPLVRFVHAADLHLDSPFKGLREIAPGVAETLYTATFDAYDKIIDLCLAEKVDALLIAGDIFDSADRSLRAQLQFTEGLRRLDQAGIRSFVCHGNHDPLDGWEPSIGLPDGCHRFGAELDSAPVFPDEPDRAVVHGISYPQRDVRDNLVPQFAGRAASGRFSIGLLHANVDNNSDHEAYAPCSKEDLVRANMDYWALGHVHTRQVLSHSSPTIVYPGNPQGRNPNERGARGVYLVEVDPAGRVDLSFRAVDLVRWESPQVDINELESEQDLLEAIEGTFGELQDEADERSLVVRLRLVGSGLLHDSLERPDFLVDLGDKVNEDWSSRKPFLWCERIVASTTATFDRQQRIQGSDFVADLLRLSDESKDGDEPLDRAREQLQDLYSRRDAGKYLREHLPSDDEMRAMMSDAEQIALSALAREDD